MIRNILSLFITLLFCQNLWADGFDPFIDYSDFEEASQEESDVNFFHNGRLLSVGLLGGIRGYTGTYGSIYDTGGAFGLYVAFFFDLQFAMQVSYTVSDHAFAVNKGSVNASGKNETTATSFEIKYYTNTQNVTKGLASFNPYLIGGFSQIYQTVDIDEADGKFRNGSLGFNGGVGIEIPFSRHSSYFGAEAKYTYVNFNDENKELIVGGNATGLRPEGDIFTIMAILGTNF